MKSNDEWKKILSPEEYHVLREKKTEEPFTGKYYKHTSSGEFLCSACHNKLFFSDTKYESNSGWPSFFQPKSDKQIICQPDHSQGMKRTEVLCANCNSHLGHVFKDGPPPTGLRYCINSIALTFQKNNDD